jgi:hypothetical protein
MTAFGKGMYMDWYCSHAPGVVHSVIAEMMAKEGWTPEEIKIND